MAGSVIGEVVELLTSGAGGELPYVLTNGPGRLRDFSPIARPEQVESIRSPFDPDLVLLAQGGRGDLLLISPAGEIYADLVEDAMLSRSLHRLAGSLQEFLDSLELDDDLLDDLAEYAHDDGFPDRPSEIAALRQVDPVADHTQ